MHRQSIKLRGDKGKSALRQAQPAQFEVVEPTSGPQPFFSFSYSVTEVSSVGGRTRVRSRSQRLADGKLVSESFHAELDGSAFERMVGQFAGPWRALLQPFGWLLPRDRGR